MNKNYLTIIIGDQDLKFQNFQVEDEDEKEYLKKNNNKVKLSSVGFAEEWENWVNYKKSYAYIKDEKLYVVVYGIPEFINKVEVEKYYKSIMDQFKIQQYGEFFETNLTCPICVKALYKGKKRII